MKIVDEVEISVKGKYERGLTCEERFWNKVDKKGDYECWNWLGALNEDGYGTFFWNGKNSKAHRYSYIREYGEIPEGTEVTHACNNPKCVNHKHLKADTHQGNVDYMKECGRERHPKAEERPNRIFDWKTIKELRKEYSETTVSEEEIAKKYGTSRTTIDLIINNRSWIDDDYKPPHKSGKTGEHNSHAKLAWTKVRELRERHKKESTTYNEFAIEYGVSRSAIDYLMRNLTWFDKEYQEYLDNKRKNKK